VERRFPLRMRSQTWQNCLDLKRSIGIT